MLYLLFHIGRDRYALPTERVVEVLPLLVWKELPGAPDGVVGVCNYHGAPVPVLDLAAMATGVPGVRQMSTRLLVVDYGAAADGARQLIALIAEDATTMQRLEDEEFVTTGVASDGAPYLGPVANTAHGMVQRVEVERLLTPEVRDALFRAVIAAADGVTATVDGVAGQDAIEVAGESSLAVSGAGS